MATPPAIDALYRVRAHVAPRMAVGTRFIGLGVVALGGFLAVEVNAILGAAVLVASVPVTWVTGVWVVPGSTDAYFSKIANIINDCHTNLQYGSYHGRKALGDICNSIEGLTTPQSWLETHKEVLAAMHQIDSVLSDRSAAFIDRAVGVIGPGRILQRIRSEFDSKSAETYVRDMAEALDRYKSLADDNKDKSQRSLRRLQARINKLHPPRSLVESHQKYREVLDDYVASMNAYYVVSRDGDAEVRAAATKVETAYANLDTRSREYIEELGLRTHHTRGVAAAN